MQHAAQPRLEGRGELVQLGLDLGLDVVHRVDGVLHGLAHGLLLRVRGCLGSQGRDDASAVILPVLVRQGTVYPCP